MQRLTLTTVNVIDIETTCWERNPPADQEQEIIEIGICTLDVAAAAPLAHESLLVKPAAPWRAQTVAKPLVSCARISNPCRWT
jgi:hypothetical protein